MTIDDLTARFPEIPADLRDEPALAEFAEAFGAQLAVAEKPSACLAEQSAGNHYYMKLVNPIAIYAMGLAKREMVLKQIGDLVAGHKADPAGFAASLLPEGAPVQAVRGPGCG